MYYIYCYTNKINQHKYIGQTNNLKRRIREHHCCAFNKKSFSYNHLIHKKIREYGEENFEITIIEKIYTEDIQKVNERERYWIQQKNSFCGNGCGYNMDLGGGRKASALWDENKLELLKNDIKSGLCYYEIESKYHISLSFISAINHGIYFFNENEKYPIFQYYNKESDYDELIELLLNSDLSLKRISENLNLSYSTVKKINAGTLWKDLYPTHPIRTKTANELRADKIKKLLLTTNKSNKEIAKITASSEETVRRIKIGQTFKDEQLSYPLSNL